MNYHKMLEDTISDITNSSCVPTLLLHSCCAPCSSYVLEYLSEYFEITVLYYNPNIYPPEEFEYRQKEQLRFIEEFPTKNPVSFIACDYDSQAFYEAIKGFENEPERGKRCSICYRLRLEETARYAKDRGFDFFTTTLSISPMKDAARLNTIGEELSREYGVAYLYSDFKKKNGYLRSTQISNEYDMYRQDYCGCVYSKREREAQKG